MKNFAKHAAAAAFSAAIAGVLSLAAAPALAAPAAAPSWLEGDVAAAAPGLAELRHKLHAMPELGNQEVKTQAEIIRILKEAGIEVVTGWANAPTAVVGVLNPEKGDTVALRADIDALPIKERTGLPYASKAKGTMWGKAGVDVSHMCGHDAHVSMLLTAAQIMAKHRSDIPRRVIFVFQPAEEGDSIENPFLAEQPKPSGANALVKAGIVEKYDVKHFFGIHVMARAESGKLLVSQGPALNSADAVDIRIEGVQAHGAMPWTGVDAALAASQTVVSLQQIVARNVDLTKGMGVITIGRLQAGETGNVMAGSAEILGTIRANHPDIRTTLLKRIPEVAQGTCEAAGAKANVKLIEIYPVTWNDPALAAKTVEQAKAFGVDASISTWNPGASEDFSFFAAKVPSVFMFLGVDKPGEKNAANNHSDRFIIDDAALPSGVKAHIAAAMGDWSDAPAAAQ